MEAKTREGANDNLKKKHKIDKSILDLFWTLAEGDDTQRVQSAEKLLQYISTVSDETDRENTLNYCLQRLVRGLASNRKFAQVGFAVALTKLVRSLPDVNVACVLKLIRENLRASQDDKKSETGSKYLGQVFAYGSLIQSGKLNTEEVSKVTSELCSLSEKRSYIKPMCTHCLLDLVAHVDADSFSSGVWCHLKGELSKGWEDCCADRLLLLLACRKKEQSPVDKAFLRNHWGSAKIVGKKTFTYIHHLVKNVIQPQLLPQLLEALVAELIHSDVDVTQFWKNVGNPLVALTLPRKHMAFRLLSHLLTHADSLEQVSAMLFPEVATVICRTAFRKDPHLLDICKAVEAQIVEKCRQKEKSSAVLDMVKNFIRVSCQLNSSDFLHSAIFSDMLNSLEEDDARMFGAVCMDAILRKDTWLVEPKKSKLSERWSRTLASFLPQVAVVSASHQSDFPCHILQFLLLHSFFRVVKESADIQLCQVLDVELSTADRGHCQALFYKILAQQLSARPEGVNKQQHVLNFIQVVTNLAHYAEVLLQHSDNVTTVKPISKEVLEEWQKVMAVIQEMEKKQKMKSSAGVLVSTQVFNLLILHLAFNLFTEPKSAQELLQDVYVCREKAISRKRHKKADDAGEPDWVEVMTEVLLSLLSRGSKFARKTAVAVFGALDSHLTPTALHLIIEVLKVKKSKESMEEDLFEFEHMETDSETNGMDKDRSDSNDGVDVMSAEESDDSDDGVEEGDVDDELRKSVKAALGPAACGSDDDGQEDLSDSEMFQLDEQLASAFRSMKRSTKKEQKEKKAAITQFQLRALDLIEVVIKGGQCGDLGLELLEPLLQLVVAKSKHRSEGQQSEELQLCQRATELFHHLCKKRNLRDHIHTRSEMLEVLKTLVQMAHSVNSPQLAAEVANGCLFIMRILSQPETPAPSPIKTRNTNKTLASRSDTRHSPDEGQLLFLGIIQEALNEKFVVKRDLKISPAFFSSMIHKYPLVFWPLTATLIKSLQSPDTKVHTKTQACSLLALLLQLNKRDSLSESEWQLFVDTASPIFREMVLLQQKENLKSGLMLEVLTVFCRAANTATDEDKQTMLPPDVINHLAELKSVFNKDTRCAYNRLTNILHPRKKTGQKRKRSDTSAGDEQNSESKE